MDNENLKYALDQRMDSLRSRINDLRAEIMQAENELTEYTQLAKVLESIPPGAVKALQDLAISEGDISSKTQFQRIVEFLMEGRNSPKTIPEIMEGTGISRSSVAAVLYRTHVNNFVKSDSDTRHSLWRLRVDSDRSEEDIPF